jgi:hypothetical protein
LYDNKLGKNNLEVMHMGRKNEINRNGYKNNQKNQAECIGMIYVFMQIESFRK